jgi:N-acetylglucosaminyl-diphospho-decaprenol L-rhamnosyltransferase
VADGPTVSIIVVAFRARDHVLACLETIAAEVQVDHEVVVVDDGSGDGTPEAVRAAHPAVTVVARPVNGGLVAGRNDGLRAARGRYVLMLDADTRVREGAVETLVDVLESRADVGLVGPRLVYPDGSLQLSSFRFPPVLLPLMRRGPYARWVDSDPPTHRHHQMRDWDHASERPVVWLAGAAQMYRRELSERLGPYDRRISSYGGEDIDWCLRVWAAGLEVRYVATAVVEHHFQQVTRSKPYGRASLRALVDWYYIQLKHRRLRRDPRLLPARA